MDGHAYERHVSAELSQWLLGPARNPRRLGDRGTAWRVLIDEVFLDHSPPQGSGIVILYRDLERPACRFGWRMSAREWPSPDDDYPKPDPDLWTTIVYANFREHIVGSPHGLPQTCSPDTIIWTG